MRVFHPLLQASLALAALVLAPALALAQSLDYGPVICTGLAGCPGGIPYVPMQDIFMTHTLPTAAMILIQLAAGGAVIAIVIAGVQMVISSGDDGKITNARKAIIFAIGGLALALAAAPIVTFVSTEEYGQSMMGGDFLFGPGGVIASAIRIIMILFNVGFAIVIISAGYRMVMASGNAEEFKKGAGMIKWAVIGSIFVNIARAVVQALLMLQL